MLSKNLTSPSLQDWIKRFENKVAIRLRIHLSNQPFDRSPQKKAELLFRRLQSQLPNDSPILLIYLNPKSRSYALVFESEIENKMGKGFISEVSELFETDLNETFHKNALCTLILTLMISLQNHFPADSSQK